MVVQLPTFQHSTLMAKEAIDIILAVGLKIVVAARLVPLAAVPIVFLIVV